LKTVAIVQARMGSTRFPNKVMRPMAGTPMIGLLLGRLAASQRIDSIALATSDRGASARIRKPMGRSTAAIATCERCDGFNTTSTNFPAIT